MGGGLQGERGRGPGQPPQGGCVTPFICFTPTLSPLGPAIPSGFSKHCGTIKTSWWGPGHAERRGGPSATRSGCRERKGGSGWRALRGPARCGHSPRILFTSEGGLPALLRAESHTQLKPECRAALLPGRSGEPPAPTQAPPPQDRDLVL